MIRRFAAPVLLGLLAALGATAATTNALSEAELQGRALARQLREEQPATNFTQTGILKIRDENGRRTEIPVQFQILAGGTNAAGWQSVYQSQTTNPPVRLVILHSPDRPNEYQLSENGGQKKLEGAAANIPFCGSDFWLADLGAEFFHWPQQKLTKQGVWNGRAYSILESTDPDPPMNGYSRVVSRIDSESGGLLHAEAYDAKGRKLKVYDTKTLKKVNGQWQVEEMEIYNDQTDSHTWLEFDLKPK